MTAQGSKIYVDADATPRAVVEILVRASRKRMVPVVFVANRFIEKPKAKLVYTIHVREGPDVADDLIADKCKPGDLVVTADVPLSARVVDAGGLVLHPRGGLLSEDNVRERLAMRDLKEGLREVGVMTGGPKPFGPKDKQRFANALDRWLAKRAQSPS